MNTTTLFKQSERSHNGPAAHAESTFSFLDRSASPAADRVRVILEEWFSRYPDTDKLDLATRFRGHFEAGFFELLLHEVLIRFEHKVDVHAIPPSGRKTRIDFRAISPSGERLYLEAALVTDESREERARDRMLATLYDQVNKMHLPDYFITFSKIRNAAGSQPSTRQFKKFVRENIDSLNYDQIRTLADTGAFDEIPVWTYKQGQLQIDFSVIPVSPENRGRIDHHVIGTYPGGFRWGSSAPAIAAKIATKATRYGGFSSPFLIVLNCLSKWGTRELDYIQALFGSEEYSFQEFKGPIQVRRKPDGAWYGPKGPRNTRVSAVLLANVYPWNLPRARFHLFYNPWAKHPYSGPLDQLPRTVLTQGKLENMPGMPLGQILSLPDSWPGQLFDD